MVCEYCEKEHDGSYGSGRFCSNSCARGFSTKNKRKEINEKVSKLFKGSKCIKGGLLKLCEYGCGQEGKYQLNNGKWCCHKSFNKCSTVRKKNSIGVKKAHNENRAFTFSNCSEETIKKMVKSWKKTVKENQDLLPFDKKSKAEKFRIILESQNGKCIKCGINDWNGKPLRLHLDHIDGDNQNDSQENLRYLCPNCHSQTKTYCGKNIKKSTRPFKVSDELLIESLKNEKNISQALLKCGLVPKGGNYNRAKKLLML